MTMMRYLEQTLQERDRKKQSQQAATPQAAPATFMVPLGILGGCMHIAVTASESVRTVKQKIKDMTGLPTNSFVLECGPDVLDPDLLLSDYDIVDGGEPLVLRPLPTLMGSGGSTLGCSVPLLRPSP
jgi:hypothetical protein